MARLAVRQRQRRRPPFDEHAGDLGGKIANHRCEELAVADRHSYEVAANWKILAENYHECYHCSSIHPELCEANPPSSGGENLEPQGSWVGGPMDLHDGVETMSLDAKATPQTCHTSPRARSARSTTSNPSRTSS